MRRGSWVVGRLTNWRGWVGSGLCVVGRPSWVVVRA